MSNPDPIFHFWHDHAKNGTAQSILCQMTKNQSWWKILNFHDFWARNMEMSLTWIIPFTLFQGSCHVSSTPASPLQPRAVPASSPPPPVRVLTPLTTAAAVDLKEFPPLGTLPVRAHRRDTALRRKVTNWQKFPLSVSIYSFFLSWFTVVHECLVWSLRQCHVQHKVSRGMRYYHNFIVLKRFII